MKSKEELNALKEEVETVSRKLQELTEEELAQVSGGRDPESFNIKPIEIQFDYIIKNSFKAE